MKDTRPAAEDSAPSANPLVKLSIGLLVGSLLAAAGVAQSLARGDKTASADCHRTEQAAAATATSRHARSQTMQFCEESSFLARFR